MGGIDRERAMTGRLVSGRRRWILASLGLALVAWVAAISDTGSATRAWVAVEQRELGRSVALAGKLRAENVTEYGPPVISTLWNYKISFLAPEGSEVGAGDPIVAFDTSELEERLRRNLAERDAAGETLKRRFQNHDVLLREESLALSEAEARVRQSTMGSEMPEDVTARREIERANIDRELAEQEVGYRESRLGYLDRRASAELRSLQAQRDRAAQEVAEIERKIEQMTVRALRPGVVMYKTDGEGDKKRLGDTAWRGQKVIEIPELGEMIVDAWVLESDAGLLAPGAEAELALEADPGVMVRAKIASLHHTVERRSEQDPRKVVRLELVVTDFDSGLVRPGMRVQGSLLVDRRPDVIAVPVRAIRRSSEGPFVIARSRLGRRERRAVELGRREGAWVEVVSGVETGARVLADST
jgi:HlyD family secretion protein